MPQKAESPEHKREPVGSGSQDKGGLLNNLYNLKINSLSDHGNEQINPYVQFLLCFSILVIMTLNSSSVIAARCLISSSGL